MKRDREKFINLIYYEAEVNLVLGLALEQDRNSQLLLSRINYFAILK